MYLSSTHHICKVKKDLDFCVRYNVCMCKLSTPFLEIILLVDLQYYVVQI